MNTATSRKRRQKKANAYYVELTKRPQSKRSQLNSETKNGIVKPATKCLEKQKRSILFASESRNRLNEQNILVCGLVVQVVEINVHVNKLESELSQFVACIRIQSGESMVLT